MNTYFGRFAIFISLFFAIPALAECPVASDSNMQLQVLGSGGPANSGDRASSSYLVLVDGVSRIMVDAGSGHYQHLPLCVTHHLPKLGRKKKPDHPN